jgi:bifunctional NMN adenylyltransferase/nudix hydrolase
MLEEFAHVRDYRARWDQAPYPPVFVTADAVVIQSGHVLLVRRGGFPGKGLWALPGGFVGQEERIEDAAIRELREETRLKVPARVLRGLIKGSRVFDDPHRSSRGRTITHAFLIHLPPDLALPEIRAASDAREARWVPLGELREDEMFEDHHAIIATMKALIIE